MFISEQPVEEVNPLLQDKKEEKVEFSVPFIGDTNTEKQEDNFLNSNTINGKSIETKSSDELLANTSLSQENKVVDKCPNCGTKVNSGDRICLVCGQQL